MREDEFLEATEDKEYEITFSLKESPGKTLKPEKGEWKGKKIRRRYEYSPLDECPRCGEFDYRYHSMMKQPLFRTKNQYLRGAHCENCEYYEEVEVDPTKAHAPPTS